MLKVKNTTIFHFVEKNTYIPALAHQEFLLMNHIGTLEELVKALDGADSNGYPKIMKRIQIRESGLSAYATWMEQGYTRNCLYRSPNYELILLCWDIDAQTPIHGHGGEDCWVYQVQGTVEEIRFSEKAGVLHETQRLELAPGKLTYMHDRMGYHSIVNISNQRAMTLHIYASPIDACKVYNDQKDCFEIKEMSYHTFKGSEVGSPVS